MPDRTDEVLVHLEYLREGQDATNAHLKELNGRTRKIENTSAVHSWAIGLGGLLALAAFGWLLSLIPKLP